MCWGDASHSDVYDSAPPTRSAVVWRFRVGGKMFPSPVISEGVFVDGSDHVLVAHDAAGDGFVHAFR
ncbi:MAG TPA: hypothetical protein VJ549_06010 [Geothrix sp.]|nr:hypothetical protein [Geothrix sp.]